MSLDDKLSKLRSLLAQRDEIDRQLEGIIGHYGEKPAAAKRTRHRDAATSSDELRPAGRRHPMTAEIERMLIEGKSAVEIGEACEASAPTIYTIKARLKREGKL